MKDNADQSPAVYTPADLEEFDRITMNASSPDQMTRIIARLELRKFIDKHGRAACDAMFQEIKNGDA